MRTREQLRQEISALEKRREELMWFRYPSEVRPGRMVEFRMTPAQARSWNGRRLEEVRDQIRHLERCLSVHPDTIREDSERFRQAMEEHRKFCEAHDIDRPQPQLEPMNPFEDFDF